KGATMGRANRGRAGRRTWSGPPALGSLGGMGEGAGCRRPHPSRESAILVFRIALLDCPEHRLLELLDQRIRRIMTNLLQFPVQRKERLTGSFIRELAHRPCDLSLNPDVDAERSQHLQECRNDGGIGVPRPDCPLSFG